MEKKRYLNTQLLQMHIDCMFTKDIKGNLRKVSEPWGARVDAPLVFIGETIDGEVRIKHRATVSQKMAQRLAKASLGLGGMPINYSVQKEINYSQIPKSVFNENCVLLSNTNIDSFALGEFAWLQNEVVFAQPCAGYVLHGEVISVCRSVRIGSAHEAGIETSVNHRQKGYAKQVLFAWAKAVYDLGAVPLYSHAAENKASRQLAKSAGLQKYATTYSVDAK